MDIKQKCIRLEIEYDDGTMDYGVGAVAEEAWKYILNSQIWAYTHGSEYTGPHLTTRKVAPADNLNNLYLALRQSMVTLQDALDGHHPHDQLVQLARQMMDAANDYELEGKKGNA